MSTFGNAAAAKDDTGWSNPRVLVIFGLIFLCGTSFGAVLMREYMHTHIHGETSAATKLDAAAKLGLDNLTRHLGLSGTQKQTIMDVLDEYGKFYQSIEEQRQDVALHGERRIMDCLTEPQKPQFERLLGMKKTQ